jgi:hypothetical protein
MPAIVHLAPVSLTTAGSQDNRASFALGVGETIAALRAGGKTVWLVGPVPEIGYPVPKSMFVQQLGINPRLDIRPTREEFQERQSFVISTFEDMQRQFQVGLIWPDATLCHLRCGIEFGGKPIYIDDNHLAVYGAKAIESVLQPIFDYGGASD